MTDNMKTIRIGRPKAPCDAFTHFALESGNVGEAGREFLIVESGMEALSARASGADPLEVITLSMPAYFDVGQRYERIDSGAIACRGGGLETVATEPIAVDALMGRKIAVPGESTTEALVAFTFLPAYGEAYLEQEEVAQALEKGRVDAAVLRRDLRLACGGGGWHVSEDLGARFEKYNRGLPLPLSVVCVRSDLDSAVKGAIGDAFAASVDWAMAHREEAMGRAMKTTDGASREAVEQAVLSLVGEDNPGRHEGLDEGLEILREYYEADDYGANCRF